MSRISRRSFLSATSCGAYVAGLASLAPAMTRKVFAVQEEDKVVAKEKWGRIETIADDTWAVISTPFDHKDFTTVCNGGIIRGKDRVVAIESYMNPKGAGWVAAQAKKLTGKWPTDIVVTHFHGDHSSGASAYFADGEKPNLWVTEPTGSNIQRTLKTSNAKLPKDKRQKYPPTKELSHKEATEIDLGGRKLKIVPRSGHTTSDVSIELSEPNVIYCGDLFFNRMVPNYGDAIPATLNKVVDSMKSDKETIYVPGHGPVANNKDFAFYREFLTSVENKAKGFFDAGITKEKAAKEFKLDKKFEDWYIFSPAVIPRAMNAWYKEFDQLKKQKQDRQ